MIGNTMAAIEFQSLGKLHQRRFICEGKKL
jgi:hypothetical protein